MTTWFDVTTILGWSRPAVGVIRVEAECARRFLASGPARVRFCRFSMIDREYEEVGRDLVRASLERIARGGEEPSSEGARSPAPSARPAAFAPGDVYVSAGLDWDQKDVRKLASIKSRVGLKIVLFCHDLIPIKYPHLCVERIADIFPRYFAEVGRCADVIVCVSECSRNDLRAFLRSEGIEPPEAIVVRNGADRGADTVAPTSDAVAKVLASPFILYVSTLERRKNHETVYRAYTRLIDAGIEDLPKAVFVGMYGWGVAGLVSDMKLDPRVRGKIEHLDHVSDADLDVLYRRSEFTVFPSLYEGWGLAVAESLVRGKFCLASSAGSIPEVGGDLVEYLDPWDVAAWADRLRHYFARPDEVREREAEIAANFVPESWATMADRVFGIADDLGRVAR